MENWKITLPQAVPHEQRYWEPYFLLFSIFFHQQIKMVSLIQKASNLKAESDRLLYEIAALSDSALFILVYKARVTAARQKGSLILGWVDG